jgi:5'-3' exonuclease
MLKPVYLIDSSIYIFRSYFALPDHWVHENGYSTHAVYGFAMFLLQFLERARPGYVALAFDESLGSCFRNRIYPQYKSSRALPDDELAFQLEACRKLARAMGFRTFASKRYEADDIIATLASRTGSDKRPMIVVSRDKDLGQVLCRSDDRLWDFSDDRRHSMTDLFKKTGVHTWQFPDYQALVGDPVDDIPGVPGIGPTTAAALLAHFETIDDLLAFREEVKDLPIRGAPGVAQKIEQYADQIVMARKLTRLHDRVPLTTCLTDLKWGRPSVKRVRKFYLEHGFGERACTRFELVMKGVLVR